MDSLREMMKKIGAPLIFMNPYYMLPKAELDKIPGGYIDTATKRWGENMASLDARRLDEQSLWYGEKGGRSLVEAIEVLKKAYIKPRNDHEARVALAKQALKIDSSCADAWCLLAEHLASTVEEALSFYRKAHDVAMHAVNDPNYYKLLKDHTHTRGPKEGVKYWDDPITRPLLRAKAGVGLCLLKLKKYQEARVEFHQMVMHVNPDDNQGIRYLYIEACLRCGGMHVTHELPELLRMYPVEKEENAFFAFTKVLLDFFESGKKVARKSLEIAKRSNPHVIAYLLSRKEVTLPPTMISNGDEQEAEAYIYLNRAHWEDVPGALEWLAEECGEPLMQKSSIKTLQDLKVAAEEYLRTGNFKLANENFTNMLKDIPEHHSMRFEVLLGRATANCKGSKPLVALQDIDILLARNPMDVKVLTLQAQSFKQLKKMVPAYWAATHALTQDPDNKVLLKLQKETKQSFEKEEHGTSYSDCGVCGAPSISKTEDNTTEEKKKNKVCPNCKEIHYCGKEHQKQNWAIHKHYDNRNNHNKHSH